MKIVHIAPLFTPDGAFGGPTQVALRQVRELIGLGHDVTLVGAAAGYTGALPTQIEGVPVVLFRARAVPGLAGFTKYFSPGLLVWLIRNGRSAAAVHVHLARDLLTMPSALLVLSLKLPLHVQPHGMIIGSKKPLAHLIDSVATRRVLRGARSVFFLSSMERTGLEAVITTEGVKLYELPNGIESEPLAAPNAKLDVLFLARLHARKRPVAFVDMAALVAPSRPDVRFSIVGPDEGQEGAVRTRITERSLTSTVVLEGALFPHLTKARMAAATVYVLPSFDEPFGMTVIEALSIGRPVIITDSCALAGFVRAHRCGLVTDGSAEELSQAVLSVLSNPPEATLMGERGRKAVQEDFDIKQIAVRLVARYEQPFTPHARKNQPVETMSVD